KSGPTYRNFIVCPCGGRSGRGVEWRTLAENIPHFFAEVRRSLDWLVFYFHCLPELFEQSPLLACHLGRNLHSNAHVQIAASAMRIREALRFFAEDLAGLRSLWYLKILFARKRGDFDR